MGRKEKRKANKTKAIINIIQLIFIVVLIYSLIHIFLWYKSNKANKQVMQELSQTIEVVKANDNSYYLIHNFNKENNSAGWIFMVQ